VLNRRYWRDPARQREAAAALRLSAEDLERSVAYAEDRHHFGLASSWIGTLVGLGVLAAGGLGLAERWAAALHAPFGVVGTGLAFFALLGLAGFLFELPFDLYATFVIEERHGFNRQTLRGFCADALKGLLLGAVLGGLLLGTLLLILARAGSRWWLLAWATLTGFSLLTAWIYPTLLAPLFNRFAPLPEGELKQRIETLAARIGFRTRGIFVMDASRRSSHGNAYFTGLFGAKRIVLFDTLVEALGATEIAAVLAHELGHFKLHHVRWALLRSVLATGGLLWLAGLLRDSVPLYEAFQLRGPSPHGALLLFGLWLAPIGFLLRPLASFLSRRNEFAADAFALAHAGARDLGDALLKLRERSRSLPLSHPWYSRVYYSHPPLLERLRAIGYV
jgi:STE24 endopeptidase